MTGGLLNQAQWAKRHGFSRQYVGQLVKNGVVQLVDGLVEVAHADKALACLRDSSQPQRHKNATDSSELSTLLMKSRIKNEMERGKILEARAKTEVKEFIAVEAVKTAAFNKARIIRDSLLNIPDRVASLLASIDDEHKIYELLSQEVCTALERLTHGSNDI